MTEIRRVVDLPDAPDSREWGYAQVVVAGATVYVSGQGGWDATGRIVSPELAPQVRQTYANIERALATVGAGLQHLVATTTFITDWRYGRELTALRAELLAGQLPTSALIGVASLADPGMLVEIQSVAVLPGA
ncbi:RidA family protein [Conexibacter woesei]|uniref:Endoribonuclease L-PSP n=1 Tax=Conexibacter woesei (strain DSM 14684 / CCUG 47730 / CIP 108061 / JCM 11494 / NBRC 100937 / ID131577) TaxID=469383 RepID=D3EYY7_CONWI|nr:RidA family protein [Conexibacter woesei]ADB49861.1 Endoribonuclease L-PSP [Conexibacter woesei DSM 14684]